MNKSYSNKALPAGTILREWRLEEVLGVGGFGIVYKGRGIYFGELVAIKEYFPSAISERQDGDTVVPIDSNAEEVHALGLKKFVEEAKLLWNLSTPTRHPNIVSVRSLFEIHGTAYIVMDFEDGQSLSKLLREGKRFNQTSLLGLVKPVAEGLERAHRVGVLHRDIKPPNILVSDEGRPVLIDFGSARFESGDATSTKVTFHTPPYAAIEQYVKTYPQGPWTDIYALGVVLYECITGEKPPEVLERMHGGLGTPLAEGEWPGFSRSFLKAVDAAMTIRPADRPQSIHEWLAMFDLPDDAPSAQALQDNPEDVTRFVAYEDLAEKIVPVAPTPPGFEDAGEIEVPVPDSTSEVEFKRAGRDTNAGRTQATEAQFLAQAVRPAEPVETAQPQEPDKPQETTLPPEAEKQPPPAAPVAAVAANQAAAPKLKPKSAGTGKTSGRGKGVVIALAAGAGLAAVLGGGGWYYVNYMAPHGDASLTPSASGSADPSTIEVAPVQVEAGKMATAVQALAADSRRVGAPASAINGLDLAAGRIAGLEADRAKLTGADLASRDAEIASLVQTSSVGFANALGGDAEARGLKLARDVPWANPQRMDAARAEPPQRQNIAYNIRQARAAMMNAIAAARSSAGPAQAITSARLVLQTSRRFIALIPAAYAGNANVPAVQASATSEPSARPAVAPTPTPTPAAATSATGVSAAKMQRFNATVAASRGIAAQVISMARARRPASNAPKEAMDNYNTLQQNKSSAQGYQRYLDNLANSLRGAKNDQQAEVYVNQADQTKRYLDVLLSRSTAASQ